MAVNVPDLDEHQARVVKKITRWVNRQAGVFQIHGRAGTGKTTLIRHLTNSLETPVLTPTNKAAAVLISKGVPATTIHKFLYTPSQKGTATEIQALKDLITGLKPNSREYAEAVTRLRELTRPVFNVKGERLEAPVASVIVDEASMVDTHVASDLCDAVESLVAFGDPWQLPPVKGKQFFKPPSDETLEHIYRQAEGSGILDIAYAAYTNYTKPLPKAADAKAISGASLGFDRYLAYLLAADQVIVGTHKSRKLLNHLIRCERGLTPYPQPGDTLTCVRSPTMFERDIGLVNGYTYNVTQVFLRDDHSMILYMEDIFDKAQVVYRIKLDEFFMSSLPSTKPEDPTKHQPPLDYDYALTAHKAQGSEFPSVVIQNEANVFPGQARKWLYTALTRAQKSVVLITGQPEIPKLPQAYVKDARAVMRAAR